MVRIFTIYLPRYIYPKHQLNVGKHTTHGFYGISCLLKINLFHVFLSGREPWESKSQGWRVGVGLGLDPVRFLTGSKTPVLWLWHKIWQTYETHMVNIWQIYETHMVNIWQIYETHMVNIWQIYENMANIIGKSYGKQVIAFALLFTSGPQVQTRKFTNKLHQKVEWLNSPSTWMVGRGMFLLGRPMFSKYLCFGERILDL